MKIRDDLPTRVATLGSAQLRGCAVVVDDDIDIRESIEWQFTHAGCTVFTAADGEHAVQLIREKSPEVVIIDLVLPGMGGLDIVRESLLLEQDPVVIVMSGHSDAVDRIVALELGADDFVEKPFSTRELLARVSACLRRRGPILDDAQSVNALDFGGLIIDLDRCEVRVKGRTVRLTRREFDLLVFLARAPGCVFSKSQLLTAVWNTNPGWIGHSTVVEHVRRIRQKVEVDPADPKWLKTVRGHGYMFDSGAK